MPFEHQISITSETGVGGTSLFRALQDFLVGQPYRWVSCGDIFRTMAGRRGMTVERFAAHCRAHPEERHDQRLDRAVRRMARSDWMIGDGRLVHFLMPEAFKVLLVCDINTRAKRRMADIPHSTFGSVAEAILDRDENDRIRYEALYPGCLWDEGRFDLVLNTGIRSHGGEGTPDELAKILLKRHARWVQNRVHATV